MCPPPSERGAHDPVYSSRIDTCVHDVYFNILKYGYLSGRMHDVDELRFIVDTKEYPPPSARAPLPAHEPSVPRSPSANARSGYCTGRVGGMPSRISTATNRPRCTARTTRKGSRQRTARARLRRRRRCRRSVLLHYFVPDILRWSRWLARRRPRPAQPQGEKKNRQSQRARPGYPGRPSRCPGHQKAPTTRIGVCAP